jgi:segregation and condensation protein B
MSDKDKKIENIEKIVEALLFSSDIPLPAKMIRDTIKGIDVTEIKKAIRTLREEYAKTERSFDIVEVAQGFQMVTKPEYGVWIHKMYKKPDDKIRGASMETLAIIVYKQPITKAEVEAIRGVNVDGVIKTLLDKNLIEIQGRKDCPGRPLLYGTTNTFLLRFGLNDINSLPPLKEFTEQDIELSFEGEEVEMVQHDPALQTEQEESKTEEPFLEDDEDVPAEEAAQIETQEHSNDEPIVEDAPVDQEKQ